MTTFADLKRTVGRIDAKALLRRAALEPATHRPAGGLVNRVQAAQARTRRIPIPIDTDRRHVSRIDRQRMIDARRHTSARAILDPLPLKQEAVHIVLSGTFNSWDFVPAVAELIHPATIDELVIATLSFNQTNADELFALLDRDTVRRCLFLASNYFRDTDPGIYEHLQTGMQRRGQPVGAARSHAKIIAVATADGRHYVIEGSANLRSCKNIEQATAFCDRALFDFHRQWIAEAITRGSETGLNRGHEPQEGR